MWKSCRIMYEGVGCNFLNWGKVEITDLYEQVFPCYFCYYDCLAKKVYFIYLYKSLYFLSKDIVCLELWLYWKEWYSEEVWEMTFEIIIDQEIDGSQHATAISRNHVLYASSEAWKQPVEKLLLAFLAIFFLGLSSLLFSLGCSCFCRCLHCYRCPCLSSMKTLIMTKSNVWLLLKWIGGLSVYFAAFWCISNKHLCFKLECKILNLPC